MRLPRLRRLFSQARRRRPDPVRQRLLEPVRLTLRRLEERRVLDVSAAFLTATGELSVNLSQSAEAATISVESGDIVIRDQANQRVDIGVDQSGPGVVGVSSVKRLEVRGDANPDQHLVLDTFLVPANGVFVDSQIESTAILESIRRVGSQGVLIESPIIELADDIEAPGTEIFFGGDVTLANDVVLTGSRILFAGRINDDGSASTGSVLTVNASELSQFSAAIGDQAGIERLKTDALGQTELGSNITAVGGSVIFNDPVLLTGDVEIVDSGATGIIFNSTVNSQSGAHHDLTLTATAGRIAFGGDIGGGGPGDQSLGTLTITTAAEGVIFGEQASVGEIRVDDGFDVGTNSAGIGGAGIVIQGRPLDGMSIHSTGDRVRFNGAVELRSDLTLETQGGDVTFTSGAPVDSQANTTRRLTIDAGSGAVFFNNDLGGTTPLGGLLITRADAGITFGNADVSTPHGDGPVQRISTTGPIDLGSGANVSAAIRFNAGDGSTFSISTTGDQVRLNGPVHLESDVEIKTGAGPGDIVFTSDTPIDSAPGEQNDLVLDAGAGGVLFNADIGAAALLGKLTVNRADRGVIVGEADIAGGGGTQGPVQQILAQDGIDLGSGDTEIGGAGIVLNGGTGPLRLSTEGEAVRLNGVLTLNSDVFFSTGSSGGDIIFTNDTPVDSQVGESNDLLFDAGQGSVRLNEDLGEQVKLGSLIVERAAGGVLFGEATSEIPGTGTRGPVSVIQTLGTIDVGVGGNVIGGSGIVFNGSLVGQMAIQTKASDIRFNGATRFAGNTEISTGDGSGDITFTADAPVDSVAGRHSDLALDAGEGRVIFNEDLGAADPLGALTVLRAGGGVAFGGAGEEVPGSGQGPVNLVRTERAIDVGAGFGVIGGRGIELNGGSSLLLISTTDDDIRLNGPVLLQSEAQLSTGADLGNIRFTSAAQVDSSDGPEATTSAERNLLVLDAGRGRIAFNADLGAQQRMGGLAVDRAAGGLVFGESDAPGGDTGPVQRLLSDGEIDLGRGNAAENVIQGGITFNGGAAPLTIHTSGDGIRINGAVVIHSDLSLQTASGPGDVELTAHATLDSQIGEANNLALSLGEGNASFAAAVGSWSTFGELRIETANDVLGAARIDAERIVQLAGTGTTTLEDDVRTTSAAQTGIDLNTASIVLHGAVTAEGDGRIQLVHSALLDIADQVTIQAEGSFREEGGGSVRLGGDVITSGDEILFRGSVTLTDPATGVLLDTTSGGHSSGATIEFESTMDGEFEGVNRSTLNAGSGGDILFRETLGAGQRLDTVRVVEARDVIFDEAVAVTHFHQDAGTGTTTFSSTFDASSPSAVALALNTENATFLDAVTTRGLGAVEITIRASGQLTVTSAANMQLSGSFTQLGEAPVHLAADITTASSDMSFQGAVTIADDLRLETGGGLGDIVFHNTIDGLADCGQKIELDSGDGAILFSSTVGQQVPLGDVIIETAADVTFASGATVLSLTQLDGGGTTQISGVLTIKASQGTSLRNASIVVDGQIDTRLQDGVILLQADSDVDINGSLRSGRGLLTLEAGRDIRFGSAGSLLTMDTDILVLADSDAALDPGGAVSMANGSTIHSGSGLIDLRAGDGITIGQLVSSTLVRLTSDRGAVVDGGDAGGADIMAPEIAFRAAAGVGEHDFIETETRQIAARNRFGGGFRISNDVGDLLTIGEVDGLSGILLGPEDGKINEPGDLEIINVGTIQVDRSVQHNAGDDSIFRAEVPGDLIFNAPVQNRGGDGWIVMFSGGDLVINDSLPEAVVNGAPTFPQAEVSVENRGAIRGEARGRVLVDNSPEDYAILRTRAERFPDPDVLPAPQIPDPRLDPAGFQEALRTFREAVSPQVVNVPPLIEVFAVDQGGSTIDQAGRAQLAVIIGDPIDFVHLERNFHLTVDWGDGVVENYPIPGNPLANSNFVSRGGESLVRRPDATVTGRFDSGLPTADGSGFVPSLYFVHHTYTASPNPDDPSAPVTVRAELRYDARREGELAIDATRPWVTSGAFNGIRFFENVSQEVFGTAEAEFQPPGLGQGIFIKVVESEIVPVAAREESTLGVSTPAVSVRMVVGEQIEYVTRQIEAPTFDEYRLFLRVVDDVVEEDLPQEYPLPLGVLADPVGLFEEFRFPDGHYRIYLEEIRTKRQRLILDVHVFEGRVVPPDFREGAGERRQETEPEGAQQADEADADAVLVAPGDDSRISAAPVDRADREAAPAENSAHETDLTAHPGAAAVGLVAHSAGNQRIHAALRDHRGRFDRAARLARKLKRNWACPETGMTK